jgi:hypothetical protein
MDCCLCGASETQARFAPGPRNIPGPMQYWDCASCGLVSLDPQFYLSAQEERQHYLMHSDDTEDAGYQKFVSPLVEAILKSLPRAGRGLDYGAGRGPVVSAMLARQAGHEIKLYDPFFFPDESYRDCKYHFVFASEVVEHFHNPYKEFSHLSRLLEQGGHLFAMTHVFDDSIDFASWYYRRDPTHVAFYREKTLLWISQNFLGLSQFQRPHPRVAHWHSGG